MPTAIHSSPCIAMMVMLCVLLLPSVAAAEDADLARLTSIRDELRSTVDERFAGDAARGAALDIDLHFDHGIGPRQRPMVLHLQRLGGAWAVARISGREADRRPGLEIDCSQLRLSAERLHGPIHFRWDGDAVPSDDDQASDEQDAAGMPAPEQGQVYRIDVAIAAITPRLRLNLRRFASGQDWVMHFQRPAGDAADWQFVEEASPPRALSAEGGFERSITLEQGEDADTWHLAIQLTNRIQEGRERVFQGYEERGHPRIQASFALVGDQATGIWLRQAAGGKNFIGNASGTLSGAIEDRQLQGNYHSNGLSGEWTGDISGTMRPGQAGSAPLDVLNQDLQTLSPPLQAARLFQQIVALDHLRRHYPMPMQVALDQIAIAEPLAESMNEEDQAGYVRRLRARAEALLGEDPPAPTQLSTDEAPAFGPYQASQAAHFDSGQAFGADDSPHQRWQHLSDWQFCGPFFVLDSTVMPRSPSITSKPTLQYQRQRLVADRSGAEIDHSPARWLPALVTDQGFVHAPDHPLASAGGMHGMDSFAWYASSNLHSAKAHSPWVALRVQGAASLWVNDVLVWQTSGHREDDLPDRFRLPLQAGDNTILLRVHSSRESNRHFSIIHYADGYSDKPMGRIMTTGFALHLAASGDPGQDSVASSGGHWPDADGPRGHRQDWHGRNPDADPPLAFHLKDGTNVAWSLPLPLGHGEPVYAHGRLYVVAEPHRLYCIDAASGELLWQRSACILSLKAAELISENNPDPLSAYYDNPQSSQHDWQPLRSTLSDLGIDRSLRASASQSPVVTKDGVFVQFGTGVAAHFDHDGNQRWLVATDAPANDYSLGHPLVLGDTMILQVHRRESAGGDYALLALDTSDGSQRWLTTATPRRSLLSDRFDYSQSLGNGVAVMRLIDAAGAKHHLLLTGDGAVIDPADGRILLRRIFRLEGHRSGPVIDGDTAYAVSVLGEEAAQLWLDQSGTLHARTRWLNRHTTGRGNLKDNHEFGSKHIYPAPLLLDDRLLQPLTDRAHVPQHYPLPWMQVDVWRRSDGQHRLRQRKVLEGGTDPTLPPRLMGNYILVGDGGDPMPGFQGNEEHGQLAFITADEHALPISRVNIGKIRAAPVAIGSRLYLRQYDALYALEISDEAGRRYQNEVMAESLFAFMPLRQPPPSATSIPPRPAASTPDGAAVVRLRQGSGAGHWLFAGPIPRQVPGDHLQSLGGIEQAVPVTGDEIAIGNQRFRFQAVDAAFIQGHQLDALAPTDYHSNSITYFTTVFDNPRVQRVRFQLRGRASAWLNGEPVKDGDVLELGLGHYTCIIRSEVGNIPPFARERGMSINASFASAWEGGLMSYDAFMQQIHTHRPHFEGIIEDLSGSRHAARARLYLQTLENYRNQ